MQKYSVKVKNSYDYAKKTFVEKMFWAKAVRL